MTPADGKAALTKWRREKAQRERWKRERYERTRAGQLEAWERDMQELTDAFSEAVEILKGAKP